MLTGVMLRKSSLKGSSRQYFPPVYTVVVQSVAVAIALEIVPDLRRLTSVDTTSVRHDTEDNEANKKGNLQTGKPELDLAIIFYSEEVCCYAQNQKHGDVSRKLVMSN